MQIFIKKKTERICIKMVLPYSAEAENLNVRNNLMKYSWKTQRNTLLLRKQLKCSTDLVSFEMDICWTAQCRLVSDYLRNKQDLAKQISPRVANIFWLHFSRFILKSPPPHASCFLFFSARTSKCLMCADSTRHSLLGDSLSRQWNYAGQDGVVTVFFRVCLQYGKSS